MTVGIDSRRERETESEKERERGGEAILVECRERQTQRQGATERERERERERGGGGEAILMPRAKVLVWYTRLETGRALLFTVGWTIQRTTSRLNDYINNHREDGWSPNNQL